MERSIIGLLLKKDHGNHVLIYFLHKPNVHSSYIQYKKFLYFLQRLEHFPMQPSIAASSAKWN